MKVVEIKDRRKLRKYKKQKKVIKKSEQMKKERKNSRKISPKEMKIKEYARI